MSAGTHSPVPVVSGVLLLTSGVPKVLHALACRRVVHLEQRATLTRGVLLIAPFRFVATSAHTQLHLPKPPATIPASFKGQRSAFPNGARAVYNITPIRAEFHTGTSSMMLRRYNLNTCLENHSRANKALQREPRPPDIRAAKWLVTFSASVCSIVSVGSSRHLLPPGGGA